MAATRGRNPFLPTLGFRPRLIKGSAPLRETDQSGNHRCSRDVESDIDTLAGQHSCRALPHITQVRSVGLSPSDDPEKLAPWRSLYAAARRRGWSRDASRQSTRWILARHDGTVG